GTVSTGASVASRPAVTTVASISTVPSSATLALRRELRRHQRLVLTGAHHHEALGLLARRLGRQHAEDLDALDGEVGIRAEHLADLGTCWQQRPVQLALGLLGTGCTPGPAAVGAFTGELDLDTTGHRGPNLPNR